MYERSFDNPVIPAGPEADKYAYTDEMDLSVAPGDDFYQYVLGSWLDENPRSQVGPKGTMALQDQQGADWLKSIFHADSPNPAVALLYKLVENAASDLEANIANSSCQDRCDSRNGESRRGAQAQRRLMSRSAYCSCPSPTAGSRIPTKSM